jgi:hypothetical protein
MGLYEIGSGYSYGFDSIPGIRVSKVGITRDETLKEGSIRIFRWDVRVEYTTPEQGSQGQVPENPLDRPVVIRGASAGTEKQTQKDKDDNPIKNTADELYPPISIPTNDEVVEFVRNEASSPANTAKNYRNRVNSSGIWGRDTGEWRCLDIDWEKVFEGEYVFYRVSYKFLYKEGGHKLKLISNGYNQKVSGQLQRITDASNLPLPEPSPLDASGVKTTPANGHEQTFDMYKTANFAGLGLPSTI